MKVAPFGWGVDNKSFSNIVIRHQELLLILVMKRTNRIVNTMQEFTVHVFIHNTQKREEA